MNRRPLLATPLHNLHHEISTAGAPSAPELHCPFEPALHPEADRVNARSIAWARRVGLASSPAAEARLEASKIGWLIGRAHPRGTLDRLQIAADWTLLFCVLDDRLERLESPGDVMRALAAIGAAIDEGVTASPEDPFQRAAADLHARLAVMATPAQRSRFSASVRRLFMAFADEARARCGSEALSPSVYLPIREITVGIHAEIALGEIVEGIALSEIGRARAARLGLARRASNLIAWANDVYTYEKEIRDGDPMNLVAVLAASERIRLGEAVSRVVAMHDDEARAFAAVTAEAMSPADAELARYAKMLRSWVRGHLDWGRQTGRYRPARA